MRIILTCGGGFSTAVLAKALEKIAQENEKELIVEAIGYMTLEHHLQNDSDYKIVLVAPQIRHKYDEIATYVEANEILIDKINFDEYAPIGAPKLYERTLKDIME